MAALMFPSSDQSQHKARVRFISRSWEMGKPDLINTKGIKLLNKGDADIQLYLPGNFQEGYGAVWDDEDVVTTLMSKDAFKTSAVEFGQSLLKKHGGGAGNSAIYDLGMTALPGKFLIFKQGREMTLNFNFELIPRNSGESKQIKAIVDTFKNKILATYAGSVLHFPDVWDIQFLGIKGPGFPDSPKAYTAMALVGLVPSYIGGASSLTYSDEHPVGIGLQLSFQSVKKPYLDRAK